MAKRKATKHGERDRRARASEPVSSSGTRPTRRTAARTTRRTLVAAPKPPAPKRKSARLSSRASRRKAVRSAAAASRTAGGRRPASRARQPRRQAETVPTPPSSLDMERRGSAARAGRSELAEQPQRRAAVGPTITGGDVDANWEGAYFTDEEAPGGDNPTPDQDVVDDIGKALGVEYQDNEELKAEEKNRRARQTPLGAGSRFRRGLQGAQIGDGRWLMTWRVMGIGRDHWPLASHHPLTVSHQPSSS